MNKRITNYELRITKSSAFTLIEILVVIAIIAMLVAFSVSNFVGARSRARDVKHKSEMQEIKNALRLFYSDHNNYPGPDTTVTNTFNGCGTASPPSSSCGSAPCNGKFAAGGSSGCGSTVYMKLLPQSTEYTWSYVQKSNGDDFCLWTTLENKSDADIARSQTRCSTCAVDDASTDYVVCAD